MTLSVVVVEDQPLARDHLGCLLDEIEGVECVGQAADGFAGLELIQSTRPDLAFLDIEMPGISGIEVLRRADPRPLAIFTTAYNQHAVTAFELHALDYLLKPFGADRLRTAVERALNSLPRPIGTDQIIQAESTLHDRRAIARVFVRSRGFIVPVVLEQVEHFEAHGDYVELWVGRRSYLIRLPLKRLMERLDAERFVRIHRSHVINIDRVTAFVPASGGRFEIVLESGKRLTTSRSRTPELRARLGVL